LDFFIDPDPVDPERSLGLSQLTVGFHVGCREAIFLEHTNGPNAAVRPLPIAINVIHIDGLFGLCRLDQASDPPLVGVAEVGFMSVAPVS
jgi:hypothetical protein